MVKQFTFIGQTKVKSFIDIIFPDINEEFLPGDESFN